MRFAISLAIVDATRKRDVPRHSCRGLRAPAPAALSTLRSCSPTGREDISNPEAPASRSLTSEFGLPVAGASFRRKKQSEPTSTSPEKSGRTGTSPEQTGVEGTQLARRMFYGLPTLRFQRRSESSENSVQRHCETLDVDLQWESQGGQ
jgi:hypothetical protein